MMPREAHSYAGLPPYLEQVLAEEVRHEVLPNGLKVLHKPDHSSQLSSVQIWVKTGSIHEGKRLGAGLSHYLEHMLFKGTERRRGPEIAREVQAVGGYINAYTTFDRTVYHIDLPSESTATALDILADMVAGSLFDKEDVERERDVILREIDMALDDPDRCLSRALLDSAYRVHPYRFPVIGHRELFERVRRKHLIRYHERRYVAANMVLVVVGDVTPESLEAMLENTFAALPRRPVSPVLVPAEPPQLARRECRLRGDVQICRDSIAYKVPGLGHPDAPALDLMASILGRGNSSVLWRQLREKRKLVHEIDATCWNPSESGLFWISLLCDPAKREKAESAVREELDRVRENGITEEVLDKARRQAMVSEVNARKTMAGQAMRLGLAEVVVGDLGYPREYFRRLQQVTPGDITRLLETQFHEESCNVVSYTSPEKRHRVDGKREINPIHPFQLRRLSNGVRLLVQEDHRLPKTQIRVGFLGGPLYEPKGKRGITALLSTMLVRDTRKRSADQIAESIEQVGGVFHEFAGNNSFGLSLEVMTPDAPLAVDLLAEALLRPRFLTKTVRLERDGQIAQIREDLDEILEYGKKALRRHFFGEEHPFAVDPYGTVADLRNLKPADLREHYERLCVAENMVVAVNGVMEDGFLPALESVLAEVPARPFTPVTHTTPLPQGPRSVVEKLPREQAVVFHTFPEPGVYAPDYFAGEVLDELLSDMSGQLFCRVREERSLAYFVGATRLSGLRTGMFTLFAGTHPDTAEVVLQEFQREVERIREGGFTPEEVERCKTRLKAARRSSLQVLGARAMQAVLDELYGLPENSWMQYDAKINAITPDQVQAFAQRHLIDSQRLQLVVSPR